MTQQQSSPREKRIAVTVTKDIQAPVAQVFDAWLRPEMVRHWFAPGLGPMTRVEIDPVPGGRFHFDQQRGDEVAQHWGTYQVIERPHRLVFTWQVDGVEEADTVSVEFTAQEGGCRITLTHDMDARFAGYRDATQRGWRSMLGGLGQGLAAQPDSTPQALVLTREFNATPEQLFAAWTDPAQVRQWLFTSPQSESSEQRLDVREGGRWEISDVREGQRYTACGEYLEVSPPTRLVFTFAMPQFSPNSDRITITLQATAQGCLMVLRQEGEDIAAELSALQAGTSGGSEQGWLLMFRALAGVLARHRGQGERTAADQVRFERLLPGPLERVWAWIADGEKRAQWLGGGDLPERVGARFQIHFHHQRLSPLQAPSPAWFQPYEQGVSSDHEVLLYEPPHRLMISWDEHEQGGSQVLFELTPEGDRVRLVLTHQRLADDTAMLSVSGGWHTHLAMLEEKLAGRTPESFWTLFGDIEQRYVTRFGLVATPH
ncbi:hypothetical protein A167_03407 [Alcanivorax sp. S71-1-4]|uniref:SRPBCC domain-containing protein n=1 Tax=Alcanivorax sp. S71-1-4 TaxID=1177159 RepID=UPI00135786F8|nr:SRPBCC domain-containing protein [Alcanivorax sp. S71-1-4]KAF0805629.1 hypothetical protein A167_03407 [Alcanivorax sp. S71-1-4]